MAFYTRKKLTELWKPGDATKDCDCICCKNDIKAGTPGWISTTETVAGFYFFLCFLCWDTWTNGDVSKGLAKISRFRKEKPPKEQKVQECDATGMP